MMLWKDAPLAIELYVLRQMGQRLNLRTDARFCEEAQRRVLRVVDAAHG